jgi:hypothetical protein
MTTTIIPIDDAHFDMKILHQQEGLARSKSLEDQSQVSDLGLRHICEKLSNVVDRRVS